MKTFGEESFTVRSYEVDGSKCASLFSLVNYFQEAASNNAAALGASVYDLRDKGVSWVLHRMQIKIIRFPRHGESISVQTWPSGSEKIYFYRDFKVVDGDGNVLAEATSVWLVFDIEIRKMVAVPDFLSAIPINHDFAKVLLRKDKISEVKDIELGTDIIVTSNDLDINEHVNNAHFYHWLLEPVPSSFLKSRVLSDMDVIFKREVLSGTKLFSYSEQLDSNSYIHMLKNEEGLEVARASSRYV